MIKMAIIGTVVFVLATSAVAQWTGVFNPMTLSSQSAACSNSLDFSQACNSQYFGTVIR